MSRLSVIKTISMAVNGKMINIDVIKTNHAIDRQLTRGFDVNNLVEVLERALDKVLERYLNRVTGIRGVIQSNNHNIMFGMHYNNNTRRIDFEIVSYMYKENFITNNIENIEVIKI